MIGTAAEKVTATEFAKKHDLPNFEQWIQVSENMSPGDVRAAFQEKLYDFTDRLYSLMRPEEMTAIAESGVFSEQEHVALELLYNELMLLLKECDALSVLSEEKEELVLVRVLCAEWPRIASEMKRIVLLTKKAYNTKHIQPGTISYLG